MPLADEAPPTLSLGERDRRWTAVRDGLERARVEALVIAGRGAASADLRYLTDLSLPEGSPRVLVLPRVGSPVVVHTVPAFRETSAPAWLDELIVPAPNLREAVVDRLRAASASKRLAVAGLISDPLTGDAAAPAAFVNALRESLPGIELVDFTDELRQLRSLKSNEEINLLRHSAQLLDAAFAAMDTTARPGLTAHELWAVGIGTLCRLGSELSGYNRWASGARPRALARPAHGLLAPGFVVACELEAVSHGYGARALHARAIGTSGPVVPELYCILGELWEAIRSSIEPDVPVSVLQRQLRTRTSRLVKQYPALRSVSTRLALHGAGLGADLPAITGSSRLSLGSQLIRAGWACSLAVSLRAIVEGRQYLASWADPIVIAPHGAVRLGRRAPAVFPRS